MKTLLASVLVAASLFASYQAGANEMPAPKRVEIPFANHGGIDDWKAEGTGGILIKSSQGNYYRATFTAVCLDLPYTERVGFDVSGTDTLDKFGAIEVRGHRCSFDSFTEIPKPATW